MEVRCERIALGPVVRSVLGRLDASIKESRAEVKVEQPLADVCAHAEMLELAVLHLVKNAITFVAPWVSPKVRIWTESREGEVRLWIEDNGIGRERSREAKLATQDRNA